MHPVVTKVETELPMLLQTNSYIVPKDKRAEHSRLLQRFRQCLARLGCEHFEAYEQVGANWSGNETTGRFVQLMRFKDRKQQQQVQMAEKNDAIAQALIKEFCELINFPYQQQQGLFAVGFYQGVMPLNSPLRQPPGVETGEPTSLPRASTDAADQNGAPSAPPPLPIDEVHPPDIHGENTNAPNMQSLTADSTTGGPSLEGLEIIDEAAAHDDATGEIDPQSLRTERSR